MLRTLAGGLIVALLPALAQGASEPRAPRATPELVANVSSVAPGTQFDVALRFKIDKGWHLYWLNPGDSGLPPTVEWNLPPGVTVSDFRFPVPHRIKVAEDMTSFGYEDELVLLATVTVGSEFTGKLTLAGKAKWLVCKNVCLAESKPVELSIPVGQSAPAHQSEFEQWRQRLPKPEERKAEVRVDAPTGTGQLRLTLDPEMKEPDLFPPPSSSLEYAAPRVETIGKERLIVLPFRILAGAPADQSGPAILAYTDAQGRRQGVLFTVHMQLRHP